eukprot:3356681-Prymnesium_polylepis.1
MTLPHKVTKSVPGPALGGPNGVLALQPFNALRKCARRHCRCFQSFVRAHQHSSKAAPTPSSGLQVMAPTRS